MYYNLKFETVLCWLLYVIVFTMFSKKLIEVLRTQNNSLKRMNIRTNKTSTTQQEPVRMEKTINSVQLLGRVGGDPQLKGTNEHPVAVFSLATHVNYRYESGEFLQRTEWHRVICFKPGLRETVMNYLKKGQRVHVAGKITYGEVKSEDGSVRSTTSIQADDIIFFQNPSET